MQIIPLHRKLYSFMQIDLELLKKCIQNNRIAQKKLYEICYKLFMPACLRYNSSEEDARFALNIAFVKVISNLNKEMLKDLNFIAWAKRIVTNVLIDEYRKKKNYQMHYISKETEQELDFYSENTSNEAEGNFEYENLLKLIEQIPKSHSIVFKLFVMDNFSHKEIANQLNISEGTSKWHLSTARKLLREKLELIELNSQKKMVI